MGVRRQARECALQIMFQIDLTGDAPADVYRTYFAGKNIAPEVRAFACALVNQAFERRADIDQALARTAEHWRIERMATVDRNVLRLAVGEFLADPGTPRNVVINEAIDIARKFSGPDASQFVNGVLDAVKRRLEAGGASPAPHEP